MCVRIKMLSESINNSRDKREGEKNCVESQMIHNPNAMAFTGETVPTSASRQHQQQMKLNSRTFRRIKTNSRRLRHSKHTHAHYNVLT